MGSPFFTVDLVNVRWLRSFVISTSPQRASVLSVVTWYFASSGVITMFRRVLTSLARTRFADASLHRCSPAMYCSFSGSPQVCLKATRNMSLRVLRILWIILGWGYSRRSNGALLDCLVPYLWYSPMVRARVVGPKSAMAAVMKMILVWSLLISSSTRVSMSRFVSSLAPPAILVRWRTVSIL